MRGRRTLFTILRVSVSVGLLVWVYTIIEFRDTVNLQNGTERHGSVTNWREIDKSDTCPIILASGGQSREITREEIAPEATVHLADGSVKRGKLIGQTPESVTIQGAPPIAKSQIVPGKPGEPGFTLTYYRRGLLSILRNVSLGLIIIGIIYYGLVNILGSVRWWVLLKSQKIPISLWNANRLTFLGYFFNNIMPGLTGGDIVKSYYVAQETHQKTGAITTVFLDRLIGLVCLAIMAGVMILVNAGDPKFRGPAMVILIFLGATAVLSVAFFSRRVRRALRINVMVKKLPFEGLKRVLWEIDHAVFLFRNHKTAILITVLLSFVSQSISVSTNMFFGAAMGLEQIQTRDYFVFLPIVFMIMSIPISLSGWGVGERSFQGLLATVGVPMNQAAVMGVLFNVTRTIWSLPGAAFLAIAGKKPSTDEMKEELKKEEDKQLEDLGERN